MRGCDITEYMLIEDEQGNILLFEKLQNEIPLNQSVIFQLDISLLHEMLNKI